MPYVFGSMEIKNAVLVRISSGFRASPGVRRPYLKLDVLPLPSSSSSSSMQPKQARVADPLGAVQLFEWLAFKKYMFLLKTPPAIFRRRGLCLRI